MIINNIYYKVKWILPRRLQIYLRRIIVNRKINRYKETWPILQNAAKKPERFLGWPKKKRFALILTHDVETNYGQSKCLDLMKIEKEIGLSSSFNFVPERYKVSTFIRNILCKNGFEVGVHGLKHDGKLYQKKKIFIKRATKINWYIEYWNAVGFRSPAMHHNLEWLNNLNIVYDASTFDTDPFEPQSDGLGTIFPFYVKSKNKNGYIELPYTLPQDHTVFILMKDYETNIWRKKLDWIAEKGGMALLNTHPDYMSFTPKKKFDEYPVQLYVNFLKYIQKRYINQYWHVLPKEIAFYWKEKQLN